MLLVILLLVLLLLIFGGLGFLVHWLWFILIALLILWLVGFFVGHGPPVEGQPRRRWYRW